MHRLHSVLLAGLFICVSCQDFSIENIESGKESDWQLDSTVSYVPATLSANECKVRNSAGSFEMNLFKDICSYEDKSKDVLISPLSATMCLSLLSTGANGKTFGEIATALGFDGMPSEDIMSYYKKLSDCISSTAATAKVSLANAVWTSFEPKKTFEENARYYYNAQVEQLDFINKSANATKIINDWTKEKTYGMIEKILDKPLSRSTSFVIENVVYFNSSWDVDQYDKKDGYFRNSEGKKEKAVLFGANKKYTLSYFDEEVSVLRIPYKGKRFYMEFFLPAEDVPINTFISSLTNEKRNSWKSQLDMNQVTFMIPEFDCTFTMKDSFKKAVIDRGIQLVWGNADFSNLSDSEMHLSEIIQKSVISVSHKGAVAATSTIADGEYIDDDDNLYYFIADRPFVYAIIEQSTDALLFLGVHR